MGEAAAHDPAHGDGDLPLDLRREAEDLPPDGFRVLDPALLHLLESLRLSLLRLDTILHRLRHVHDMLEGTLGKDLRDSLGGIVFPLLLRDGADMIRIEEARLLVLVKILIRLDLLLQRFLSLPRPVDLLLAQLAVPQHHRHLLLGHELHGVVELLADDAHPVRRNDVVRAAGALAVAEGIVVVNQREAGHLRLARFVGGKAR